jgi:hypothetical protein
MSAHVLGTSALRRADVGKWSVETLPNEVLGISLDGFRFRERGGQIKRPGVWHVAVQVSTFSGGYELCFDPDLDTCFIKKG